VVVVVVVVGGGGGGGEISARSVVVPVSLFALDVITSFLGPNKLRVYALLMKQKARAGTKAGGMQARLQDTDTNRYVY
jgi:hypothetical protein